jgi:hypothetical protein
MTEDRFTLREPIQSGWPIDLSSIRRQAVVVLGIGALLAVIGPFGTFTDLSFGSRLAYWLSAFVAGWVSSATLGALLYPRFVKWRWSYLLSGALVGLLGAIPLTAVVLALEALFRPEASSSGAVTLYLYVISVNVPMSIAMAWSGRGERIRMAERPAPDAGGGAAPFLKRIPSAIAGPLLALQMEDHYLRIHTAAGNDLILFRLSDALDELKGVEGARVHRSYWVARAAVVAVERVGRKTVLVLSNDLRVPVSRTYAAELKDAGWLPN